MEKQKKTEMLLQTNSFIGQRIGENLGIHGPLRKRRGCSARSSPSMNDFSVGIRKNLWILDIQSQFKNITKTLSLLLSIIKKCSLPPMLCNPGKSGHLLLVNSNPEISNLVDYFASEARKSKNFGHSFSYCNSKWVGGTLTNWNQISKSMESYGSFSKRFGLFITRNNIYFPRYRKLKKSFGGFVLQDTGLKKPTILLVINPNENPTVLYEAKKLKIPVIAFTDTNTDISLITYPIPVNDQSQFFVHYYLSLILRILKSTGGRVTKSKKGCHAMGPIKLDSKARRLAEQPQLR